MVTMNETSLAIFSRGALLLSEANTIQKAKDLKDLALTAADWARRKGMGEEAVQYARSYALDAERKMGQILLETPKARPAVGSKVIGDKRVPMKDSRPTLREIGLTKRDSSQAQKLARLPEEKFQEVKAGTLRLYNADKPHVSEASGENEWYTPLEYIKAVREVLGIIDCDPASSEKANHTVKAKTFFTIDDDGLSKKWNGRVFMNPPYAQPLISQFSTAIVKKFKTGEIEEACILVNNATETAWFQCMAECSSSVCFPKTRIRFLDPSGNPGAPLQGQAVIYFGKSPEVFCRVFERFGITWSR